MKNEFDWGTYEDWKSFMPSVPHGGDSCTNCNLYWATLGGAGGGEWATQRLAYKHAVREYCNRHNIELPWVSQYIHTATTSPTPTNSQDATIK